MVLNLIYYHRKRPGSFSSLSRSLDSVGLERRHSFSSQQKKLRVLDLDEVIHITGQQEAAKHKKKRGKKASSSVLSYYQGETILINYPCRGRGSWKEQAKTREDRSSWSKAAGKQNAFSPCEVFLTRSTILGKRRKEEEETRRTSSAQTKERGRKGRKRR